MKTTDHIKHTLNIPPRMEPIEHIAQIKAKLATGQISYAEAVAEAKPHAEAMDAIARGIAKKYGKKHYPFAIAKLLRQ